MSDVLVWLENNQLSVFIREFPSVFGFPTILFLHTLGLAMVAGPSIAIDLWILRNAGGERPAPHYRARANDVARVRHQLAFRYRTAARLPGKSADELGLLR